MAKNKFLHQALLFSVILVVPLFLVGCLPSVGPSGVTKGSEEFVKGSVVRGFPSLPLYPKAGVLESYGSNGKYGASFITNDSLAKVVKFYNDSFKKLGWNVTVSERSETNYVFSVKNDEYRGEVIVNRTADGKKTAITMAVESR